MTAVRFAAPARVSLSGLMVGVVGCALLLARPWIIDVSADPTAALVVVFVGIGLAGAMWPVPGRHLARPSSVPAALIYTGAGVAAFALGRLLGGGEAAALATDFSSDEHPPQSDPAPAPSASTTTSVTSGERSMSIITRRR